MSDHIIFAKQENEEPMYVQLRENHHLETYTDYAGILAKMKDAVVEWLEDEGESTDPLDPVAKQNLETLANLLPICSDLFVNCDDYYRRYPKR